MMKYFVIGLLGLSSLGSLFAADPYQSAQARLRGSMASHGEQQVGRDFKSMATQKWKEAQTRRQSVPTLGAYTHDYGKLPSSQQLAPVYDYQQIPTKASLQPLPKMEQMMPERRSPSPVRRPTNQKIEKRSSSKWGTLKGRFSKSNK